MTKEGGGVNQDDVREGGVREGETSQAQGWSPEEDFAN